MKFYFSGFYFRIRRGKVSIPVLEPLNNYLKKGCTQQLKINRTHPRQKPKHNFFPDRL